MRWLVRWLAQRNPRVLFFVETTQKAIALTIDDGPDARVTPEILDLLNRYDARATFFLIASNIVGNEAILRRIVAEGHELANHLSRDEPATRLSAEAFKVELQRCHDVLTAYSDNVTWFRPGSGRFNESMLDTLDEHGYRCALGSVYPLDAEIPSSWFATRVILWAVKPGSVVILHDIGARGKRTVATLNNVLPELRRRGFRVVTLSQLRSFPK
ncbi:MAG: chitin deacetylase family protein [Alphaproteobacteria bacterium]|nr:chitin deacetylase family protein [Alphaproteobacteria bacterium]